MRVNDPESGSATCVLLLEDEVCFLLPILPRLLKALRAEHIKVRGVWLTSAKLGPYSGSGIPSWALKTLGPGVCFRLGLLALAARMRWVFRGEKPEVVGKLENPNKGELAKWLEENPVDFGLSFQGWILKEPVLSGPKLGWINKHASLLPAHRGLWPFFWARLQGDARMGVSFHRMTQVVDGGELLSQTVLDSPSGETMAHFYRRVFQKVPELISEAVRTLLAGEGKPQEGFGSVHSLPNSQEARAFRLAGGKWVSVADVWQSLRAWEDASS